MRSAFEPNVFTSLSHDYARACAAADDRTDRGALSATRNRADDGANAGCRADFRHIIFRGITPANTAFSVNLRLVIATHWRDLNEFRMKLRDAIVVRTNLIERELELRNALHFAGPFNLRDVTVDGVARVFRRLDDARLNPIATLAGVSRDGRD